MRVWGSAPQGRARCRKDISFTPFPDVVSRYS
nr:MAG TPA: hypothetical protein [Caudoviricetes sp.]